MVSANFLWCVSKLLNAVGFLKVAYLSNSELRTPCFLTKRCEKCFTPSFSLLWSVFAMETLSLSFFIKQSTEPKHCSAKCRCQWKLSHIYNVMNHLRFRCDLGLWCLQLAHTTAQHKSTFYCCLCSGVLIFCVRKIQTNTVFNAVFLIQVCCMYFKPSQDYSGNLKYASTYCLQGFGEPERNDSLKNWNLKTRVFKATELEGPGTRESS